MSTYQPLADYLANKKADSWEATFADVEDKLGRPLPRSAYRHQAWWANQSGSGHSQTHGWKSVGWRTAKLDLERERVRFERTAPNATVPSGGSVTAADDLFERAHLLSGIEDRHLLIEEALRALIEREAAEHLIAIGGTMPDFKVPSRERSEA